jgi:signal transduction histidine kinase
LLKLLIIIGIFSTSYGFSKSSEFRISYYEDQSAQLQVETVIEKLKKGEFIPYGDKLLNPGLTTSYFWIAVTRDTSRNFLIENPYLVIKNPHINRLHWYVIDGNEAALINQTGDYFPYSSRMLDYTNFAYPLLPQDSIYLLKVDKRLEKLQLPATVLSLADIQRLDIQENLIYGIFSGAIIILLFFSLFLFYSTRNTLYLLFFIHIFIQFLYLLTDKGISFRYLWPEFEYIASRSRIFLITVSMVVMLEFAKKFIHLDKQSVISKTVTALQVLAAPIAILILLRLHHEDYPKLTYFVASFSVILWSITIITLTTALILQWRAGIKEAKIYALSHIPLLMIGMMINSRTASWVQLPESMGQYGLVFGNLFTMLILLFGVTFVFNEYKSKNLTLLTQINEQQKLLTQRVLEAQESERKAIGQKIHDEVSAKLSVSMMHLSTIKPLQSDIATDITTIHAGLNDVRTTLRDISQQLMPMDLEKYGFKKSLESFINSINQSKKMHVEYVIEGFDKVENTSTAFKSFVYRTLLECTNNIIKHSSASHVFFQLLEIKNSLTLVIEDNGIGFDSSKTNAGYGLTLIKAQTNHYQGKIEVHSQPNEGTSIIIELPII